MPWQRMFALSMCMSMCLQNQPVDCQAAQGTKVSTVARDCQLTLATVGAIFSVKNGVNNGNVK
jgi:hypothetical protein